MTRKSLVPFILVVTGGHNNGSTESQLNPHLQALARDLGRKMDLANPVMKAFVAGSLSGTFSTVLFQPLDLVKTRIQNERVLAQKTAESAALQTAQTSRPRLGMLAVARQVLATDHVAGLWRGIMPSVARTVPGVGIYFSTLHWLQTRTGHEKPSPIKALSLGVAARTFAATIMIPITVLKTRFESGQFNYNRMSTALVCIYRNQGVRAKTCGLLPTIIRDAPYSGLYLMFYTQLNQNVVPRCREVLTGQSSHSKESQRAGSAAISHFACGLAAGFGASLLTHPADVVKTRVQIQPELYRSFLHACRTILVTSGPRGFLIGFAPRMLRRALMSAFAWTVYEEIMKKLGLK